MDKYLNNDELKLQILLEDSDFDELTTQEQTFVLSMLSEQEYNLQRRIITESPLLFENNRTVVAPPLLVGSSSIYSFWFKKNTYYQTVLAIAATVLLMFWIRQPKVQIIKEKGNTEYVSNTEYVLQRDTIIQKEYITDTVIQYIDKEVIVEVVKYKDAPTLPTPIESNYKGENAHRVLEPAQQISMPDLGGSDFAQTPESSLKNDNQQLIFDDIVYSK